MFQEMNDIAYAFAYVPPQRFENRYSDDDAIIRGTLFPELDLPFGGNVINEHLPNTPVSEFMKLCFVSLELRLYCDTHPNDRKALMYLEQYQHKAAQWKEKYSDCGGNAWVYDPWPWEGAETANVCL